jgi:hypothetical protein
MQEDERDLIEVLIFDEIEETVGTWLRTIIQRLEKEQEAVRRHHPQRSTPSGKTLRQTLSCQKHDPKLAKPACRAAYTSSSDFGPIQF